MTGHSSTERQEFLQRTVKRLHADAVRLYKLEMYDEAIERWEEALHMAPESKRIESCITLAHRRRIEQEAANASGRTGPLRDRAAEDDLFYGGDEAEAPGERAAGPLDLSDLRLAQGPRASHRHRGLPRLPAGVVLLLTVLIPAVYFGLSYWNNRSFWLHYRTNSIFLDVYQGHFFPVAREKIHELRIGARPDWYQEVADEDLRALITGQRRVVGARALDRAIIRLYVSLARAARARGDQDDLMRAAHYLRSAEQYIEREGVPPDGLDLREPVESQLIEVWYDLARLLEKKGDTDGALTTLSLILDRDRSYQDASDMVRRLEAYRASEQEAIRRD